MKNNDIIILVIIVIALIIVGGIFLIKYLKGRKIDKIFLENQATFDEIYKINENIQEELNRCEKISRNEKTIDLLTNWKKEYETLSDMLVKIRGLEETLKELVKEKDSKNFYRENEVALEQIENVRPVAEEFYNKLKNYTNYEIDNTQMALNLKERLKELTNIFDQKLKMIDVYNSTFLEETTNVKLLIKKFENEQKRGNYPRARVYLKDCNDSLVALEKNILVLIEYYETMYNAEEKINTLKKIKNKLEEKELKKFEIGVEEQYISKKQKRDDLLLEVKKIKFNDIDSLSISLNEVKYFDEQIDNYIKEIEENYNRIEQISNIQKKNEEEIKFINELITGAIEEKETIEKLYSLEDISYFEKVTKEKNKFDQFKLDYSELNNIFKEENIDFSIHLEKFTQSNKYLKRVLANVKLLIEGLKAIRSDEIEIIEKVKIYKEELINLNLYLRENNHLDSLNFSLESMYIEITQKIGVLEEELAKEPLDIGNVRINNDIIEKLIRKLIFDIETDIKQKKGVEKLMLYYNRFITSHEYLEYYKHFLSLYNTREYRQILKEVHRIFVQMNPRGEELYKNIVSTVVIEEYKSKI